MEDVRENVERLWGALTAMEALTNALIRAVPAGVMPSLEAGFHEEVGVLRDSMREHSATPAMLAAFEKQAQAQSEKLNRIMQDQ